MVKRFPIGYGEYSYPGSNPSLLAQCVHRMFQSRPLRSGWISKPDVIFIVLDVKMSSPMNFQTGIPFGVQNERQIDVKQRNNYNWKKMCPLQSNLGILASYSRALTSRPFDL